MDRKDNSVVSSAGDNAPAVSVIVPCYNDAKYVPDCLDSLLAQTFQNWEAICINDGSSDNTLSVLKKYARCDQRIRVINQKNQGVCFARNRAIAVARGKYIYPLDADDKIAKTCLEELYNTITTTDYVLVCTDGKLFGTKHGKWDLPKPTKWNMYNWHNAIHNSAMYPKKLWEKYGGYYEGLNHIGAEDFDFMLHFVDDGQKFTRIAKPLFFYRVKAKKLSRNARAVNYGNTANHLEKERIILERHPKMLAYEKLKKLKKILMMLPRFIFCIKYKFDRKRCHHIRYVRVFRIPIYWWKVKE
ncbi:MAG: glycosyltransferase [Puniceicoccales bacterium]|nr:glycosyltransferase [Puniceicoccales bacterium]